MTPLYTAEVTTSGNRKGGHSQASDGHLSVNLSMPTGLGGAGGDGTNPEQLFAAGYSACFASAINHVASLEKVTLAGTSVTAKVSIGKNEQGTGFALAVELQAKLDGVDKTQAQALVEKAHQVCPYSNATRNNVPVTLTVL